MIDLLHDRQGATPGDLLLDGHSTWLELAPGDVPAPTGPVRLDVTLAPVSVTSVTGRPVGLLSRHDPVDGAGLTLGHDRRGRPSLELSDGDSGLLLRCREPLVEGRWARLTVLLTGREAGLFVDGELAEWQAWPHGLPTSGAHPWWIGRRADTVLVDECFPAEVACALLRRVTVTEYGGPEPAALRGLSALHGPPAAGGAIDVVQALRHMAPNDGAARPRYHFMPPAHWMNEPHAPVELDGQHHLFFQANRRGPYWGGIEWGHAVSTDLVRWRHLPPALSPARSSVCPDGVWSGSAAIDDAGAPLLFFTAGDASQTPDQSVAIARPHRDAAGWSWTPDERPLLRSPRHVDGHALVDGQFRDPFVWREQDGTWFMLVGAGVDGVGGTALLYRSGNGAQWTLTGPLLVGDHQKHPVVGDMWELPVLLPIRSPNGGESHVLLVCPWWPDDRPRQDRVVEVIYWIGRWDGTAGTFTPAHAGPRRFDYGRHFTGPSGSVLHDGRTVLWSIAQDGRTLQERRTSGWAHNSGLPLELSLTESGDLGISPVRELATLRQELVVEVSGAGTHDAVAGARGHQLEVDLSARIGADELEPLRLSVVGSDDAQPVATLIIDPVRELLAVSRPEAATYDTWSGEERDEGDLSRGCGDVRLRVFVDHSMLEAYVNGHRSITTRIPTTVTPPRLALHAGPHTTVQSARVWRLADAVP